LFFLGLSSTNWAIDATNCVVWIQDEPSWLQPERPKYYEYALQWERLPSKVSWDPRSEIFPMEISNEAAKAKLYLDTQITNNSQIQLIKIVKLELPNALMANGIEASNQWMLIITLSTSEKGELRSIVFLLDGTRAQEQVGSGGRRAVLTGDFLGKTASKGGPQDKISREQTSDDFRAKLENSDFDIPSVQWDPLANPFPLDIKEQVAKAKAYLSKTKSLKDGSLFLTNITLSRFVPTAAIKTRQLTIQENFHHWMIAFLFGNNEASRTDRHEVVMLLDGHIINGDMNSN